MNKENITTDVRGDVLTIKASDGDRKYSKEIVLPGKIDSGTLTTSYKNGILEIKIQKFIKSKV